MRDTWHLMSMPQLDWLRLLLNAVTSENNQQRDTIPFCSRANLCATYAASTVLTIIAAGVVLLGVNA